MGPGYRCTLVPETSGPCETQGRVDGRRVAPTQLWKDIEKGLACKCSDSAVLLGGIEVQVVN